MHTPDEPTIHNLFREMRDLCATLATLVDATPSDAPGGRELRAAETAARKTRDALRDAVSVVH